MNQPVFGLPSIDSIPRKAHPAYVRLEAEIRAAGWEIVSPEEAGAMGSGLSFCLNLASSSLRQKERPDPVPDSGFRIQRIGRSGFLVNARSGMEMALEEVRRQFVAVARAGVQQRPCEARFQPRVPMRAVRLGPDHWSDSSFLYHLEGYSALGFNGVLLDSLELPLTTHLLADENRVAEWEPRLARILERLARRDWWTMVILPIGLDLGPERVRRRNLVEEVLCRQRASSRRRLLHRFESLVRRLPETAAFGFAISDWGRCDCHLCRKATFEEESAYYLRAYSAVMKRHCPNSQLWFLPDRLSWDRLQEIQSQVPTRARSLLPEPTCSGNPVGKDYEGGSEDLIGTTEYEGEIFEITPDFEGGWLDLERFCLTGTRWEQSTHPFLAAVNIDPGCPHPANLAAFLSSVWDLNVEDIDPEEWVYRLVLPPGEWKNWRGWREKNGVIRNSFSPTTQKDVPTHLDPSGVRARKVPERHSVTSIQIDKNDGASALAADLSKGHPGPQHHTAMSNLDLIEELSLSAKRWLGEAALLPIIDGIAGIEDGTPLTQGVLGKILSLHDDLSRFLRAETSECFQAEERRCLENLEVFLSLTLSEWKNKGVWRMSDLPDLWIADVLHLRER